MIIVQIPFARDGAWVICLYGIWGRRYLLDTGASDLFMLNAEKLGVDLGEVDYCLISHGHNDHIGGLSAF